MVSLEAIDRTYAQKYKGRWIIGLDLILDRISEATPVYMNLETAIKLLGKLRMEIQSGRLEKLAEPMLYDTGEKEGLVVVYQKKEIMDEEESFNIKQDIQDIASVFGAKVISFEESKNGKFYSEEFQRRLKLKNYKKQG